jgi:hypothetical protein
MQGHMKLMKFPSLSQHPFELNLALHPEQGECGCANLRIQKFGPCFVPGPGVGLCHASAARQSRSSSMRATHGSRKRKR